MIGRILSSVGRRIKKNFSDPESIITIEPETKRVRGRVLFSYLAINPYDKNLNFNRHSNHWECAEMIRILCDMGYIVDVIDFKSHPMNFTHKYDVIVDIDINLQLYAPLFSDAFKIMHITTGYGRYLNSQELHRVSELEQRRGMRYSPKRLVHYLELFDRSLEFADRCSLIGNEITKSTFPDEIQKKIVPITVSASDLNCIKSKSELIPKEKEFVWFFGIGAVTKGLDLLLEIFPNYPDYKLNIIGYLEQEPDFIEIYKKELSSCPNIKYHGSMDTNSPEFENILSKCFCFIAPTCSEGISPAVVTLMQVGLYPIITKNSGADLPENAGVYLNEISIEEIDAKIKEVYNKSDNELVEEIEKVQELALNKYSREQFSKEMKAFFTDSLS